MKWNSLHGHVMQSFAWALVTIVVCGQGRCVAQATSEDGLAPIKNRFRPRPERLDEEELAPIIESTSLPAVPSRESTRTELSAPIARNDLQPSSLTTPAQLLPLTPPTATVAPTDLSVRQVASVAEIDAVRRPLSADGNAFTQPEGSEWDEWTPEERVNITVYEKTNRSVVNITTRTVRPDYFMMANVNTDGTGSGSVMDKKGHILTNLHVVEGAREIRVTLHNGEDFEAGLVGQDPVNDIAVLRIAAPAEMLEPVTLGESSRLRVGQKIFAIGNPFGLDRTLTVGIVSSLNRTIPSNNGRSMKSIIQIDAALNQGNSGGPLLNNRGQLIGMNTAIASETGQNTGVGFAIPVGTIRRVVPQLVENGKVVRPSAGIAHVHETEAGLLVAALVPGGPAERAGMRGFRVVQEQRQRGAFLYSRTVVDRNYADVITAVNSQSVRSFDELLTEIERAEVGDQIELTIVRENQERQIKLTLSPEE